MQTTNSEINARPNIAEQEFLNLAYNKFLDIFDEVFNPSFWQKTSVERFHLISRGFAVYAELMNYEPINWYIKWMKENRPPAESDIAENLFKFIRNVLAHFPFFESWDEIYINRNLANWDKEGQSIDRFLLSCKKRKQIKYRVWDEKQKEMTYLEVNFPSKYEKGGNVYMKDIIDEKSGMKFAFSLMRKVLLSQVESIKDLGSD